ncbi:hypothetical protein ZHAS_00019259 [Anopheles sinensis]|uniref:Uncharacterized protein n=1 Tax=Anopheles sinensis TaxID=74873 RepID=A0A084WL17_ANOSI|nr:hypothetical protein ZHAS_00019259 [Anopheles sinensis]
MSFPERGAGYREPCTNEGEEVSISMPCFKCICKDLVLCSEGRGQPEKDLLSPAPLVINLESPPVGASFLMKDSLQSPHRSDTVPPMITVSRGLVDLSPAADRCADVYGASPMHRFDTESKKVPTEPRAPPPMGSDGRMLFFLTLA